MTNVVVAQLRLSKQTHELGVMWKDKVCLGQYPLRAITEQAQLKLRDILKVTLVSFR